MCGLAGHATAQSLTNTVVSAQHGYAVATLLLSAVVMLWAFIAVRRMTATKTENQARIAELEADLNEAQAIINAEPSLLFIWRTSKDAPDTISGDLRGTVQLTANLENLADFANWLDEESISAVNNGLGVLRSAGTPFNIALKTLDGELVEADGRVAGGVATMRIRPLSGEHRDTKELMFDARRLGKQVERLSAMLDKGAVSDLSAR